MNNNFSANMLKTFKECPQKYILQYIENIQIPQSTKSADTGKNIHALINYYFNNFDTNKITEALSKEEKNLWLNFLNLNIKKENIYKSEYTFNIKIDKENWLTGRIDAIIKENGKYIIYDWKTGNLPKNPGTDLQTCIYLFSVYKILESKKLVSSIGDLQFIYINLKTSEKIKIDFNKQKYDDFENNILSTIGEIKSCIGFLDAQKNKLKLKTNKSGKNQPQNDQCEKCKYKTIC